jgi:hypothetical protein
MLKRHQMAIAKYPHMGLDKGAPYGGIENLRAETIEVIELFQPGH